MKELFPVAPVRDDGDCSPSTLVDPWLAKSRIETYKCSQSGLWNRSPCHLDRRTIVWLWNQFWLTVLTSPSLLLLCWSIFLSSVDESQNHPMAWSQFGVVVQVLDEDLAGKGSNPLKPQSSLGYLGPVTHFQLNISSQSCCEDKREDKPWAPTATEGRSRI